MDMTEAQLMALLIGECCACCCGEEERKRKQREEEEDKRRRESTIPPPESYRKPDGGAPSGEPRAGDPPNPAQPSSMPEVPPPTYDEPFIFPPSASYDSPQRIGLNHMPLPSALGLYAGYGGPETERLMVLDDGTTITLGSAFIVNHQARCVQWTGDPSAPTTYDYKSLPLAGRLITAGGFWWKQYQSGDTPYGDETITAHTPWQKEAHYFAGQVESTDDGATGQVTGRLLRLTDGSVEHTGYIGDGNTLFATYRETDGTTKSYAITEEGTYPYTGHSQYLIEVDALAQPNGPGAPSWISSDGRVWVDAGWRTDHAKLTDDDGNTLSLSAYGVGLSGGSWAAYCGEAREDGSAPAWILHESGGVITRVKDNGKAETMPRTQFETEVLRVQAGSFLRFSSYGTLFNTWPAQWALAVCVDGGTRAVGQHDPWRDSKAGARPEGSTDPAWWYWPRRPKKRPKTMPSDAPTAPFGLALTDASIANQIGGGEKT